MTAINVTSVSVLDNPSLFTNPLQFEIQYECLFDLKDGTLPCPRAKLLGLQALQAMPADTLYLSADLEWKLIYVGSAESEKYDQVLDSVLVGPVYPGSYRFVFQVCHAMQAPRKQPQSSALLQLATCSAAAASWRLRHVHCMQADPPDHAKLPPDDLVGVTVMLLTCSYRTKVWPEALQRQC